MTLQKQCWSASLENPCGIRVNFHRIRCYTATRTAAIRGHTTNADESLAIERGGAWGEPLTLPKTPTLFISLYHAQHYTELGI